jgi:murein DD-endopeptidase MepM/ murein hydrolase activator NlpD
MWSRIPLTALGALLVAVCPAGGGATGHPAGTDDQGLSDPGTTLVTTQAGFGWPLLPTPRVSRPFQPPEQPYGPGHRGADLAGQPGQPVLAAGDGVVVFAGRLADRGVVSVVHAGGLRTTYEPVLATVRPGAVVRRGQVLGTLNRGHLGCPVAACLHWGLLRERRYRDPIQLVAPTPVRLLPWPEG